MSQLKGCWKRGDVSLGAWSMLPCASAMEVAARTGFDFICIDNQHGLTGYESLLSLIRTIDLGSAVPFVRVALNASDQIGRALDAGAMGIIVPMVNTPDDAAKAVAACRYAPDGARSFGPLRASLRDGPGYFASANADIICAVMIETAQALSNVEAIAAIPGVDMLFLGPFDLSVSLGLPPGDNDGNKVFDTAVESILNAAKSRRLAAGVLSNPAVAALRAAQGFQFISVSMDTAALGQALASDLSGVRSQIQKG